MLSIWTGLKFCHLVELTLYHTMLTPMTKPFENIVGKGENAGAAFSPFSTMFSALPRKNFHS